MKVAPGGGICYGRAHTPTAKGMTMLAQFDITADAAIVHLNGQLTFAENSAFRRVVEGLQQTGADEVVIDLAALDYIDSAGMGMLLVARDLTAARGGRVRLGNASGQVARMLQLAKFGDFFALDFDYAQV